MTGFFGREKVLTQYSEITRDNVLKMLEETSAVVLANASDADKLIDIYRGKQAILKREKKIRADIVDNVVINRAMEIVSFTDSYLLNEAITYVSRAGNAGTTERVNELNNYMYIESKVAKDKRLADDFSICGQAYRYVCPNRDFQGDGDSPFHVYGLSPKNTFVAYHCGIGEPAVAGVTFVENPLGTVTHTVYTKTSVFEVRNGSVVSESPNPLGEIPIVEYVNNQFRIGAFEPVVTLLDAMNVLESNRIEATEQMVQALTWFNNVDLEDEQREELLKSPAAFIFTRSYDGTNASIESIKTELLQADQQVLANDLYKAMLTIVGMPSTGDGNTSDSSNNGSTIVRNGWQHAEARAKATEDLWRESDQRFLSLVLKICRTKIKGFDLMPYQVECKFKRRNYEDIATKATVLTTLLANDKVDPLFAYQMSGIAIDSEAAYAAGMAWYEKQQADLAAELEKASAAHEQLDGGDNV